MPLQTYTNKPFKKMKCFTQHKNYHKLLISLQQQYWRPEPPSTNITFVAQDWTGLEESSFGILQIHLVKDLHNSLPKPASAASPSPPPYPVATNQSLHINYTPESTHALTHTQMHPLFPQQQKPDFSGSASIRGQEWLGREKPVLMPSQPSSTLNSPD